MSQTNLSVRNQSDRDDAMILAEAPSPWPTRGSYGSARALFNKLFKTLRVIFPATTSSLKAQSELDELRRQWTAAFAENQVVTWQQVETGLQRARCYERPFLPSPGQFIAWIREGERQRAGIPDVDTVMEEFHRYCALRDSYGSPERFPWSLPVLYWIVIAMRAAMLQYSHSEGDSRKMAEQQLRYWASKIYAGQAVPRPAVQLPALRPRQTIGGRLGLVTARTEALGRVTLDAIRRRIARQLASNLVS